MLQVLSTLFEESDDVLPMFILLILYSNSNNFCGDLWPAACNSLNLSLSTASLQGKLEKECFSNRTPSLQAECRHTWADNVGTRMSGTKNKICLAGYNNSAQVLSAGAGMKKGCDVSNSLLSTSQLKQSASHSSGPNTISVFEQIPGSVRGCLQFIRTLHNRGTALSKPQQGNHASMHVSSNHSQSTQPQRQLCGAGSGAFLEGDQRVKNSLFLSEPIEFQSSSLASSAVSFQLSS
ncbi:hypothetical protein L7F22_041497 [Adiantum nelumboides]|nr:hypothetical protein [Adiantum nelumboides]